VLDHDPAKRLTLPGRPRAVSRARAAQDETGKDGQVTQHIEHLEGHYKAGSCNIGPAEIARRRMVGHLGLAATIVVLALLLLLHAPSWARLILVLTAGGAASGYLQAWLHFCAGFGSRGLYNFGPLGSEEQVVNPADRARDGARSTAIGLASLAIGVVVGVAAVLLPVS
jgi:hypothetical protein